MGKSKAVIIGAGPVGLILGWEFLKKGVDVEIFEASDSVGGMCRSWKWNDFILDTGPHIYHTPDKELEAFWLKEFGDILIQGDFWCKNVRGEKFNQYFDYPISWESISKYPKDLKSKILNEIENVPLSAKAKAKSYNEYIDAQVGSTLREMFFEEYPEKVWGIPSRQMSVEWAPKRIEFRQKITPFYHGQWNGVGKYGTGCIFDRIREKIESMGGKIHLNSPVVSLDQSKNRISSLKIANGNVINLDEKDHLISSIPLTILGRMLGVQSKLYFRGICSVYLAFDKEVILPEGIHWLYYGSKEVDFNRVSEPKKMSSHVAPANKTFITIETTYSKGDEFDSQSDEEIIKTIINQVEKVGLAKASEVIASTINKEDFVYPVQYVGYQEELTKIKAHISKFQNLFFLGTGGEFYYSDMQILFHKSFDLVERLCESKGNNIQVIKETPRIQLNKEIDINGIKVGNGNKAYIIAEAGLNHNGSIEIAKKLIDAAVITGCDAVKFQTFTASGRVSKKVKSVKYAETIVGTEETIFEMFDRLSLSFDDQKELFEYARARRIEIFSTPFDFESVDFLEKMGVSVYKIASMDLVNLPLIKYVAKTGKPIIMSCGMSNLGQIEEAVEVVRKAGNPNLMILHCNSSYPAAPNEMNLNAIRTLKTCFQIPIGLSDHTFGLMVSQIALSIGADIIERHFTLDRTLEGPDHILSSEPDEFAQLVELSKTIPAILGDGIKRIQANEYDTLNVQRKSLYAATDILEGERIDLSKIAIKGPGGGLLPKYIDIVAGRTAKSNIKQDHPITWDNI